jgi:AGZA family xanthine/uracil permease-like MFS transporter
MNASHRLWESGDWNAFFGFGTNILVNLLTLTALLRFVLKMPDELVFGRILPATGLMMCLSTVYYAFLAYRLAKRTGRSDVCALPSGISVGHMFIVTFVVMMPIAQATHNPLKGWAAGLTWVFVQSFVLMAGGFLAPVIRRITPRAALLGALAGVSVTFISMAPALQMFMTPVIGITCFVVILLSWFGGVKYGKIPAGLVALGAGSLIAWGSTAVGLNFGGMTVEALAASVVNFGFHVPSPAFFYVLDGFQYLGTILVTAIPFGIYDLVEAMDNVESAAVAGDSYPTTRVLTADGVVSLIGCLMGNPFINAVYIGHPGWKAMGGRVGYSAATGVMVILACWFGAVSVMSAIIPSVAILPILLYIGMLIGSQAFQETPKRHAPAIVLAMVPSIASWGLTMINGAIRSSRHLDSV